MAILYKIIFPELNKLYFGSTAIEFDQRYPGQRLGEKFIADHHNPEVQNLLNAGEFAVAIKVAEFSLAESCRAAEESFLQKVWGDDSFKSRPRWLLNRNRNAVGWASGDLHHNRRIENRLLQAERMRGNSFGSAHAGRTNEWMVGEKNHMKSEENRARQALLSKGREKAMLEKVPCPHCGKLMSKGNLTTHLKAVARKLPG
jgi:hypothetical protein